MAFLKRVAVLFHVVLVMFISSSILLFILNYVDFGAVVSNLWFIYNEETLKFVFGIIAGVLLLINFMFYSLFSVNSQKDKIIAFDNPSGQVSVSLSALEDLIKRMLSQTGEVREVRPNITASKKGIFVKIKLGVNSEVSIPEITSKVQESVLKKIQGAIGLDETVEVSVYVGKIYPNKLKTAKDKDEDNVEPEVPFQGYRA